MIEAVFENILKKKIKEGNFSICNEKNNDMEVKFDIICGVSGGDFFRVEFSMDMEDVGECLTSKERWSKTAKITEIKGLNEENKIKYEKEINATVKFIEACINDAMLECSPGRRTYN